MNIVRQTYIEFESPGSLYSEKSTRPVESRDPSKLNIPKGVFAFTFFDIISAIVAVDGMSVKLKSDRLNVSGKHFYGGTVYTLSELRREFPGDRTLIANIEDYGAKAIQCRTGNWQPFMDDDVLVSPK